MTDEKKAAPDKPDTLNEPKNDQKKETGFKTGATVGKPTTKAEPLKSKQKKANWSLRILGVILIFIIGAITSIYYMPALKQRLPIVAGWIGENGSGDITLIQQRLSEQQIEIEALKTRANGLENSLSQLSAVLVSGPDEVAADLEDRISALEQKINSLPEPVETKAVTVQDTSQSARIDMLLSRMSQLEASFVPLSQNMIYAARADKERQGLIEENANMGEKIAALETRLQAVEQVANQDNSGLLLNLKIAALKRRIISGDAYATELEAVRELATENNLASNETFKEAFDSLSATADIGLKTPDQLKQLFNDLIPEILNSRGMDEQASWWQNTLNRIKNLITVRKTDGTSYSDKGMDTTINDAENWLRDSNIKEALDAVKKLPAASQSLLEAWKRDAQNRIDSEEMINKLETIAEDSYLKAGIKDNVSNGGAGQ